jgi:hypothetical protein
MATETKDSKTTPKPTSNGGKVLEIVLEDGRSIICFGEQASYDCKKILLRIRGFFVKFHHRAPPARSTSRYTNEIGALNAKDYPGKMNLWFDFKGSIPYVDAEYPMVDLGFDHYVAVKSVKELGVCDYSTFLCDKWKQ